MAQLTVETELVDANPDGAAVANYDFTPNEVEIFKRRLRPNGFRDAWKQTWDVSKSDAPYLRGKVEEPLHAGEVWEFAAFARGSNPDVNDPLEPALTVCAVRLRNVDFPSPIAAVNDGGAPSVGGTYADFRVDSAKPTFMRMWVGERPPTPVPTAPDLLEIEGADVRVQAGFGKPPSVVPDDFNQPHRVTAEPLRAGSPYNYLILLVDEQGGWGYHQGQFQTKQRQVALSMDHIHVVDDGDTYAFGETEYIVVVYENDKQYETRKVGDRNNRVTVTNDQDVPLKFEVVVGPVPGDLQVGINAHGREFDASEDELASTGDVIELYRPVAIPYRTGSAEANDNGTLRIDAAALHPPSDSTFAFRIDCQYKIDYV